MAFADLTWEDLKEWAGDRVVGRGKSYRRAVEDLRLTSDGRLLAWVEGGDRYATVVTMSRGGKLSSACTCPYGISCKHAVAVVLTYLDAVQAKTPVPSAEKDDERLERLAEAEDEDKWDDADLDEDDDTESVGAPRKRAGQRSRSADPDAAVCRYLEALAPRRGLGGFRLRPGLCETDTTADKRDTPAPALSLHSPGGFAARDDGGLRGKLPPLPLHFIKTRASPTTATHSARTGRRSPATSEKHVASLPPTVYCLPIT